MRTFLYLFVFVLTTSVQADDWQPPDNPDPIEIKQSIRDDVAKRRYETALAKHVWFHDHSQQLQPSLSAVRLSFALSDWLKLGEVYQPALDKMKAIREDLEKKMRDKDRIRVRFEDFHEFVALNRTLRQEERTAELFQWLAESDPEDAGRLFGVAQPSLIKQKKYDLYAKFIEPEKDIRRMIDSYQQNLKMSERFGDSHTRYTENKFVNEAATLVAILVHTDRNEEAVGAADKLKAAVEDADYLSRVQRELKPAMEGKIPNPWP